METRKTVDISVEEPPTIAIKERAYVGLLLLAASDTYWADVTGHIIQYPKWVQPLVDKVTEIRKEAELLGVLQGFAVATTRLNDGPDPYDPPENCIYRTGRSLLENLASAGPGKRSFIEQ